MTAERLIEQGQTLYQHGDVAGAAESYLRAFELDPKDARCPWEAGRLYLYELNEPAKAVRWFEAALPIIEHPVMARDTRYHIGLAHVFLSEDTRAAVRFEEVLAEVLQRFPAHAGALAFRRS